ncbi:MAG TPA: cytochrome c [Campylobacterales bacterium]|nr:cytochrome c [Campylobacterales bacterium]
MYFTKPLFIGLTLLTLNSLATASNGKALVKANCASCHTLDMPSPESIPTFKAPAMEAVLFHVKDAMNNDNKKAKEFIIEYAQNPLLSKSVCESNKVEKFGLMPSLKGKVSAEDLATIAGYLIETYPTKGFVKMLTEMLTNGKMNALKASPFLMNQDALPHLTKILLENWDKGSLNLSSEQKTKLLVVRTETMTNVKKVKKALTILETKIIEMTVDEDVELKSIQAKVDEVAKLKAQATMIQLKCLKESTSILTEEQLELLLPFWGM